ncbi:hypothetical protein, partial [Xanthomonas arboricola]|uniref:hypothetical protein n=1 Tax=Xanthomonas arboricola TaxID=56448 RepID=UPI004040B74A
MLNFDSPELEAALRDAIVRLGTAFGIDWEGTELDPDLELDLDESVTFSRETVVTMQFPRSEDSVDLTIQELIDLSIEVTDPATTCDGLTYHSSHRTVVRMKSWDMRSEGFVSGISSLENDVVKIAGEIAGHPASISLLSPSPHFGAAVVVKDHFYDRRPPA